LSCSPEASRFPSGENVIESTGAVCVPMRVDEASPCNIAFKREFVSVSRMRGQTSGLLFAGTTVPQTTAVPGSMPAKRPLYSLKYKGLIDVERQLD
jgi:hypothetical protein